MKEACTWPRERDLLFLLSASSHSFGRRRRPRTLRKPVSCILTSCRISSGLRVLRLFASVCAYTVLSWMNYLQHVIYRLKSGSSPTFLGFCGYLGGGFAGNASHAATLPAHVASSTLDRGWRRLQLFQPYLQGILLLQLLSLNEFFYHN